MITREVLQLTPIDIEEWKLILRSFKSGKERETVFIPQKVADYLREYITSKGTGSDQRIFPISYTAGRRVGNKAGKVVGIHLRPLKGVDFLPRCFPSKGLRYEKHIKSLSQKIMTTYRLLIAIEHALPNWSLGDFRKKSLRRAN